MTKNYSRDVQVLTYILRNQMKIRTAAERMGCKIDADAKNSILYDEQAFDLCAMYMAQIGENVKLLSDETKADLSTVINVDILKYFRNMIDHDYEKVNKTFLLPYIQLTQSQKTIEYVKKLIADVTEKKKAEGSNNR